MLDFVRISTRSTKRGSIEVFPKFVVGKCSDLMIRGGDFYAIWDNNRGVWSTDEQDAINLIDAEIDICIETLKKTCEDKIVPLYMWDSDSGSIDSWHKYCQKQMRDNYHELNKKLIFSNDTPKKEDYSTKRLPYPLEEGPIDNYDELVSTLYSEEERHKIEWAIGAIVSGDSRNIQKFIVFYGPPGTGKSTILNIVQDIFEGYYSVFDADVLGSASATFSLEQFKNNPMVAICHEADLSRIEKNTTLNSLISHEMMTVNEKHKNLYSMRFMSFLMIGTNKPVRITDSKSGAIRRLIDISPLGNKIPKKKYLKLLEGINFELGHIAKHCLEVYLDDPNCYDDYIPETMIEETNDLFNFVEDNSIVLRDGDGISLKSAWSLYKEWAEYAKVPYPMNMRDFRNQLKDYYNTYEERVKIGNEYLRSWYSGFNLSKFEKQKHVKEEPEQPESWLKFEAQESKLDIYCADCPAQYGNDKELPMMKWENVKTKLKDIDTSKLHYLKVPQNLIVIDFDLKDGNGNKSFERNIEEASKWPPTYAEFSKSGGGVHLHYIYNGVDVTQLSRIYADDIEIKVFTGNSSLRRRVTECTSNDISTISTGLPIRKDKKVVKFETIKNEKALRTIIYKNLNKEYMGATKPSMDFIMKVLDDAYESGMKYDVSDLYSTILAFAIGSSNQSDYCVSLMNKLKLKSEEASDSIDIHGKPIAFYDVEVFPNLFIIVYKEIGEGKAPVRLINPSAKEVELFIDNYRIVGFNNRQYDNHICWARMMNYTTYELHTLSNKIINKGEGKFGEAYNLSYTDIYDYSSKKQSLKKWEIELGIHHKEFGDCSWDDEVPEDLWDKVAEYCENDVIATEAVWYATKDDFTAREILADIADMSVNDTTNSITTRIIFGHEKHPDLVYTDLSKTFPGYEFRKEWDDTTKKYSLKNWYMGTDVGLGGYVYSEPGMYGNVALIDVASMHPHSILNMNVFGSYTKNYQQLVDIRLHIKHQDYEPIRKIYNGKLAKYLEDDSTADKLSKALKLPINAVYGLTSAKFDNPFRDPRNENNIVAARGALFMRKLQDEVTKRGFKVAHIKTDSIKIPDATPAIIQFCIDFAKEYGYSFEHEATYERMCLVNDAVYIARYASVERCCELYGEEYVNSSKDICKENKKHPMEWTATGAQFAVPYVFKRCFSHEPLELGDMAETKQVKTVMYLDMNEDLPDVVKLEHELDIITKGNREHERQEELRNVLIPQGHNYKFVGKVGLFCPIKPGCGGGVLVKEQLKNNGNIGMDSVTGTKGYRWLEAEDVFNNNMKDAIDISYYESLVDDAYETLDKYGDYEWFTSDDLYHTIDIREDGSPNYDVNYCQIDNPLKHQYQRRT